MVEWVGDYASLSVDDGVLVVSSSALKSCSKRQHAQQIF